MITREIVVEPMIWWNLKIDIPFLWRLLSWGRGSMRTWFHARSIFAIYRRIRLWNIDIVYSNSALVIDGAIAARIRAIPHIWHIKETIGRQGRIKFPLSDELNNGLVISYACCEQLYRPNI